MAAGTIVAVVDDLLFLSRLEQQARALRLEFMAVDDEVALRHALAAGPELVVVDLHVRGLGWRAAVASAKERGLPVLAFGRHTQPQLLRDARDAGCDRVVARSQLVEELAELVRALIKRPA